ncbi:hypothetical protein WN51_09526 [Melipona quadrifasciata]|uniref:Uncharacterized protein n=1 Tax=Melipona quadrifasciata TaxID=166423 RepID=A0A0M9A6D8_9HYME|nr:hypothetical protein WN51_09526 [Melipona quadrifasciata]
MSSPVEDVCRPEGTVPGNHYCPSNFFTITMPLVTLPLCRESLPRLISQWGADDSDPSTPDVLVVKLAPIPSFSILLSSVLSKLFYIYTFPVSTQSALSFPPIFSTLPTYRTLRSPNGAANQFDARLMKQIFSHMVYSDVQILFPATRLFFTRDGGFAVLDGWRDTKKEKGESLDVIQRWKVGSLLMNLAQHGIKRARERVSWCARGAVADTARQALAHNRADESECECGAPVVQSPEVGEKKLILKTEGFFDASWRHNVNTNFDNATVMTEGSNAFPRRAFPPRIIFGEEEQREDTSSAGCPRSSSEQHAQVNENRTNLQLWSKVPSDELILINSYFEQHLAKESLLLRRTERARFLAEGSRFRNRLVTQPCHLLATTHYVPTTSLAIFIRLHQGTIP